MADYKPSEEMIKLWVKAADHRISVEEMNTRYEHLIQRLCLAMFHGNGLAEHAIRAEITELHDKILDGYITSAFILRKLNELTK